MKKLVLIDTNNTLYMVVFSKYLIDKYKGITTEAMQGRKKQELIRDVLKMMILKIFNMLATEDECKTSLLFAKDSKRLWRRDIFKEYKEHRAGQRDASPVDFDVVFSVFEEVWKLLQEIFPYRFVQCDNTEVDDIICETIKQEYEEWDKFVIYSRDEDFCQLLTLDKVDVFNPKLKKYMPRDTADYDLFEKVILGDKSDNIPNILTASRKDRQAPIRKAMIESWFKDKAMFKEYIKSQIPDVQKNFVRNKKLIDMAQIPDFIKQRIGEALKTKPKEFDLQKYMQIAKRYYLDVLEQKVELITNNL